MWNELCKEKLYDLVNRIGNGITNWGKFHYEPTIDYAATCDKMQMGWKDKIGVIQWVAIADRLIKGGVSHADIVLHGQSMGAATVMNVAGELASPVAPELVANGRGREIEKAVKCDVEDFEYI